MFTDADILQKLKNTEDATVERKVRSDLRDIRKSVVAFSNSLPVDDPAIIFVGVRDNGEIESDVDTEDLQEKVSKSLKEIYPPVFPQILTRECEGKKFVVVIVRGSSERPHFSGLAYIRKDSRSVKSSEEEFDRLVSQRSSKAAEILKWKGKVVSTVHYFKRFSFGETIPSSDEYSATIENCNCFYVTLQSTDSEQALSSYSLSRIEIEYDHRGKRLKLHIRSIE
jgi:predicted HTH transcriptional regulator